MAILVDRIAVVGADALALRAPTAVPPQDLTVTLVGGDTCRLDPQSPKSVQYATMLGRLRHAGRWVYLETDDDTRFINVLLVPIVFRVTYIAEAPVDGQLEVTLEVSHARHFVGTTNPRYEELVAALRVAQQQASSVLVTEQPDRPEIIDVRPANNPVTTHLAVANRVADPIAPPAALDVTPDVAQQMFDTVNGQSCPITASVPSCIPFLYPDDGCWARAHQMCRIMIANNVTPLKVWIYGTLVVNTSNSPACSVQWGWHVAPLLGVDTGVSSDQWVIDPSLFDAPVPLSDWIAIQNTAIPPSGTETTDSTIYRTPRLTGGVPQLDPNYTLTDQDLGTYELALANRCLNTNPPGPPYQCP